MRHNLPANYFSPEAGMAIPMHERPMSIAYSQQGMRQSACSASTMTLNGAS